MLTEKFNDISDEELLKNYYADQDNKWLGILLPRFTLMLLGVCMKYLKNEEDAKDCVQQIYLKVISELPKYKVTYFKSWVYMIAKNQCLMRLRGSKNIPLEITENTIQYASLEEEKNVQAEKNKLLNKLEEALIHLSDEQRKCVHLFYNEQKTYSEVSALTGYTMAQVKSHLQNGKRKLKIALGAKV